MEAGSASGSVVLVHGGFVDGSGWQGVYDQLKKAGHSVAVVQNPTVSLADDVDVTKRAIDAVSEPVTLVGHSYGGVVITEAGTHPKVVGARLHCGFRAGRGRVGKHPDCRSAARGARAADSAAPRRVSVPRSRRSSMPRSQAT